MFRKIFIPLFIGLIAVTLFNSCDKDEACPAGITPVQFKFKMVDKNTNKDLFFDTPATYATSNLIVTDSKGQPLAVTMDKNDAYGQFFYVNIPGQPFRDTLKISLGTTATIPALVTVIGTDDDCPKYFVSEVEHNGFVDANVRDQVIYIKQ